MSGLVEENDDVAGGIKEFMNLGRGRVSPPFTEDNRFFRPTQQGADETLRRDGAHHRVHGFIASG